MAKQLKIYTTGARHFVTTEVAEAVGLDRYRHQAELFVSAYTKAEAFQYLTALKLAPTSVSDVDFRVATGDTVAALVAADAMPNPGVVVATKPHAANSPAVWVSGDGHGCVQFGEFVRGDFIPDPDLVGGLTAGSITEAEATQPPPAGASAITEPAKPAYSEEAEMLLARIASSATRIPQVERELERMRAERSELCRRAVELGLADQAAAELGVTPGRVYQLKDKALRAKAFKGEFLPGLLVQIQDGGRPSRYPLATVVERPADRMPPNTTDAWVWVRDQENETVYAVRTHRVLVARPSCTICPPEEAPYGLSSAELSVHQVAKHGGRS